MTFEILTLREHSGLLDTAAAWFHEKWGVPLEAYRETWSSVLNAGARCPNGAWLGKPG